MKLCDVPVGHSALVSAIDEGDHGVGGRLAHMGFLPGTLVKVERRAPLGDPTIYELRGYRLAVRREAAAVVEVDPAPPMERR